MLPASLIATLGSRRHTAHSPTTTRRTIFSRRDKKGVSSPIAALLIVDGGEGVAAKTQKRKNAKNVRNRDERFGLDAATVCSLHHTQRTTGGREPAGGRLNADARAARWRAAEEAPAGAAPVRPVPIEARSVRPIDHRPMRTRSNALQLKRVRCHSFPFVYVHSDRCGAKRRTLRSITRNKRRAFQTAASPRQRWRQRIVPLRSGGGCGVGHVTAFLLLLSLSDGFPSKRRFYF